MERGQRCALPEDLNGNPIMEIGPADGYFTKQLAAHGASVTAFDYVAKDVCGSAIMENLHGSPANSSFPPVGEKDTGASEPVAVQGTVTARSESTLG